MAPRSVLYSADMTGCEGPSAVDPSCLAEALVAALERAGGTLNVDIFLCSPRLRGMDVIAELA